ncbi:MAG: hypothetical protein GY943_36670, partial [Chloroflexi bacterium]|nr:hypothetical protein [Chloroflexota bacterium]
PEDVLADEPEVEMETAVETPVDAGMVEEPSESVAETQLADDSSEIESEADVEIPAALPLMVEHKEAPAPLPMSEPAHDETPEPIRQTEEHDPHMEPEPVSSTEPGESPAIARRRGCLFVILGTVAGAVLGMALTLALLAALNGGSLQFADADANVRLQNELEDTNQSLDTLTTELESANEILSYEATRTGALVVEQSELDTSLNGMQQMLDSAESEMATAQAEIETLSETAVTLDERIDTVSAAAETFDAFLTGMRELLVELQDPSPNETPTGASVSEDETGTPTPTPFSTPEAEGTVTATRVPTRTPRPTSTAISLPTSTPAQQP